MHLKLPILLAASASAILLSSCGSHQTALRRAEPPAPVQPAAPSSAYSEVGYSYWADQSADTPMRVRIDLSEQTAYFYRGDDKIGLCPPAFSMVS